MSSIPIVQGVPVSSGDYRDQYQHQQQSYNKYQWQPQNVTNYDDGFAKANAVPTGGEDFERRRENMPKAYQDVVWAIAFIIHLVVMICLILVGMQARSFNDMKSSSTNATLISIVTATGLTSAVVSILTLSFMIQNALVLVQIALIFSVGMSLAIGMIGLLTGSIMMGILGFLSFATGICYAFAVWSRIPFAAVNLATGLTAVKANLGIVLVSLGFSVLAFGWTTMWFVGLGNAFQGDNLTVVFLMFLSFYWVHQVLQNTMHVTTAGVVGTWWFVPAEANSFWSAALSDSFCRAITTSFGSICFGSLLVALVQALRALERHTREKDDFQFLSCIIQCILGCLESILEGLNRWAYVYVGLYGFSYLEAGRNVMQLFEQKGWTAVITDDLAENVLFLVTMSIGLASGLVGMLIASMNVNVFLEMGFDGSMGPGFIIGFLTGFLFASIIMSVVGSGINTVIVCYAEDPAIFQMNHPRLSSEMRQAWTQAWPSYQIAGI